MKQTRASRFLSFRPMFKFIDCARVCEGSSRIKINLSMCEVEMLFLSARLPQVLRVLIILEVIGALTAFTLKSCLTRDFQATL